MIGYTDLFVAGTDTGCGKTEITLGLMHRLQRQGECVLGMKPVASGARITADGVCNEDAQRIQAQSSLHIPYAEVNPFVYESPIAPHLAARASGRPILLDDIRQGVCRLQDRADRVIVEGVGGWRVPLGDDFTLADLARKLNLPVVLVVGVRLGCINHALLTVESMLDDGVQLAGWVANQVDPRMLAPAENIATLRTWLPAPCIGEIPYLRQPTAATVATYLDGSIG
ncbi:MAG: dethiobiotin synthase [Candidatus Thiodiazotropha sp. (ex Dulcina madagascariensis)]|nr:dethiobiotin synthase [Candidatus Thiodiazotropha sp. (ex Dulcina madagascariensis)]